MGLDTAGVYSIGVEMLTEKDHEDSRRVRDALDAKGLPNDVVYAAAIRGEPGTVTVNWGKGQLLATATPEQIIDVAGALPPNCDPRLLFDCLVAAGVRV